jgi:single-strand DNA-binding protein
MNKINNVVRLIGNLGFDPEVREIAKGRKVARISVATHETWTNNEGEKVTDTQWHTVVAWGRMAEQVQRLLRKGSPLALEGRLVHRSYNGKEGIKRFVTEIVLNDFKLMGPRREERPQEAEQPQLRAAA